MELEILLSKSCFGRFEKSKLRPRYIRVKFVLREKGIIFG